MIVKNVPYMFIDRLLYLLAKPSCDRREKEFEDSLQFFAKLFFPILTNYGLPSNKFDLNFL